MNIIFLKVYHICFIPDLCFVHSSILGFITLERVGIVTDSVYYRLYQRYRVTSMTVLHMTNLIQIQSHLDDLSFNHKMFHLANQKPIFTHVRGNN